MQESEQCYGREGNNPVSNYRIRIATMTNEPTFTLVCGRGASLFVVVGGGVVVRVVTGTSVVATGGEVVVVAFDGADVSTVEVGEVFAGVGVGEEAVLVEIVGVSDGVDEPLVLAGPSAPALQVHVPPYQELAPFTNQ
ncbi:hypothetical protein AaE_003407, partial [Aphanomyces astaci]